MRLVLLHALPFDARMWAQQMDLLPGATIAPDLYGLGSSLEQWARAVADLTDNDRLIVVGCSVGGSCALEVAALVPDRIESVVVVGTKAAHRRDPQFRDAAIDDLRTKGMAFAWIKYWAPMFASGPDSSVVATARAIALDQDVEAVIRGVRAFHNRRDLTEFVRTWNKPLIVINGDQDRTPSPLTAVDLATTAPDSKLHLVRDCGHYVNLERPALFETIVRDVLAASPRDRPPAPETRFA